MNDEQLNSLPGTDAINEAMLQPFSAAGFKHLANIRLPLLELPLFQAWGHALIAEDGKTLLLLLACEPHKGIHRSLISQISEKYLVTTDFGAQQARFPDSLDYLLLDRKLPGEDLLRQHLARITSTAASLNDQPWQHLEAIIRSVITFLESENSRNRAAGISEGVISNEGAAR